MSFSSRLFSPSESPSPRKPAGPPAQSGGVLLFIGGYLGAGKTTLLRELTERLRARGLKVGLVANDQGGGLVDKVRMQNEEGRNSSVVEISGGCFCCKSDALVADLVRLRETFSPDVILAEPVGSCTDVMATVVRPMEEIFNIGMPVGRFSVLVDGEKLAAGERTLLSTAAAGGTVGDIAYIQLKQLEEAELLVVSKADRLSARQRKTILGELEKAYSGREVRFISSKTGEGVDELLESLLEVPADRKSHAAMEVDYDRYARGEAQLGWYNAEVALHGVAGEFDGNRLLLAVVRELQAALAEQNLDIAHLKASLEPLGTREVGKKKSKGAVRGAAVVQVTSNTGKPGWSQQLPGEILVGNLLVNIRATGSAQIIRRTVRQIIEQVKWQKIARAVWREEAAFQPGKPVPVHRVK